MIYPHSPSGIVYIYVPGKALMPEIAHVIIDIPLRYMSRQTNQKIVLDPQLKLYSLVRL